MTGVQTCALPIYEDYETKTPTIGGMIVREYNDSPSNFRYTKTLNEVFEEHDIPAIWGVDTRALTRIIRDEGSQKVLITDVATPRDEALRKLGEYVMPRDMVSRVSCKKRWMSRVPNHKYDVVAVDCGIKYNNIRLDRKSTRLNSSHSTSSRMPSSA